MTDSDLCYNLARSTLWVVLLVAVPRQVAAKYPEYLGCFEDHPQQLDVAGIVFNYPQVDVLDCITRCLLEGYPYVGVQNGSTCYCGESYGRYGISSDCVMDCDGMECGGPQSNDVYYTVVTGFEMWKSRALVVHNSSATFWQARQVCINEGGDLASLSSLKAIQETVKLANAKDIRSSVWFGLWQRPEKKTFVYEWTNVETEKYSQQESASYWAYSDFEDADSQHCAELSLANSRVYATNCSDYLQFVCFQPSPPGADDDDDSAAPTEAPDSGQSMLAFYIVMPFFVLCYGGSCLVYCMHKTYRQCRRQHHRRMAVGSSEDAFSEMSKEPPPSWIATAPPSIHPGEYKHRDASSDTASQSPSLHNTGKLVQARQLIVTTTEENERAYSHTGKTQRRMRIRTTGSAESLTDIRIREEEMVRKRAERKRRRENAIKSRMLPIEDALDLKKEFGKGRRGTGKILIA